MQCLNIGGVRFLMENRDELNGKRVIIPGTFDNSAFADTANNAVLRACERGAALLTKSEDVKKAVCDQFPQAKLKGCGR